MNIMVEMLCCTTKEATAAVKTIKLTFQVFNIYAFGKTFTRKDYIIVITLNIFILDFISDNNAVVWILCTTSSTCTLSLCLSERSSCIVISVLLSLFFLFLMSL